ncbi:WD40 repeat-like protein [Agrocybe pediades]|nr:WD40 repeat-like protein [Agrocybe pediades]
MRTTRITVDYATPTTTPDEPSARLLSCSANNVAFFTRGNRVHYKNLASTSEDVGQLLKLQEAHGNVRCLEINRSKGAGADPDILAVGTSKGYIQLWDVQKKKMTAKWHSKEVTAMAWNGHTLTVGNAKGVIRNYDTRAPPSKMKEQSRKSIRHEAAITTLSWTGDGKFLASGDLSGTVYCWEGGLGPPLQVGEPVQRRKKILQSAKISAVAWCPWKTKVLATGDARGIIRLWNINDQKSSSNALSPGRLETGSVITGIHFSPHCQELLTAHGAQLGIHPPIDLSNPRPSVANALAVHSFPSMGHVFLYRLPIDKPVGDSVLDGTGTKIVYTTPATSKISVCDVWAKRKERKEIKRSPSILSISSVGSSYSLIR